MSDFEENTLASLVYGGRPITYGIVQPGPDISPDGIPLIRGKDYSSGKVATEGLYHVHPAIDQPYSRSKVLGGDLLFSIVGYVGLTAQVPEELEGANITQTTARLSIDPNRADSTYVFHFLSSPHYRPEITRYEKGSAQPGLNLSDVQKLKVRHPKIPQQRRIATILTTLDEEIEATEALIAKHQQIKAGLMHDLFTRGLWTQAELARGDHKGLSCEANAKPGHLRPTSEEAPGLYQDSPLGVIPKSWQVEPIGTIFDIQLGKMLNKMAKSGRYSAPYLGNRAVQWDSVDLSALEEMDFSPTEREKFSLREGDLLVCEGGDVGRTAIWRGELENCFYQKAIHRLRPKTDEANPAFMLRFMRYAKEGGQFSDFTSQSSIAHLTQEKLASMPMLLPQPDEQSEMVVRFDGIDIKIATETTHLAKLRQQKQGLMHDLLTGRVRVDLSSK
jgi:type I restriction enzyme S subunit